MQLLCSVGIVLQKKNICKNANSFFSYLYFIYLDKLIHSIFRDYQKTTMKETQSLIFQKIKLINEFRNEFRSSNFLFIKCKCGTFVYSF